MSLIKLYRFVFNKSIVLSVLLTHRKTESYPGPVLEAEVQPLDGRQGGKVKRRGHRYMESYH